MAYHINATGTLYFLKTWVIDAASVTPNHLTMLKGKGVIARCVLDSDAFTASNGQTFRYSRRATAEIETTCEEQESLLYLLYGKDLMLLRSECVLPNTMVFDVKIHNESI